MRKYVLVGAALIMSALVALSSIGYPTILSEELGGTVRTKLVIDIHRADGSKETVVKEGDLILRNLAALLVKLIGSRDDPENEDRIILINGNAVSGSFSDGSSTSDTGKHKAKIRLGTGSPAVSIDSYSLEAEYVAFTIQNADLEVNGNDITIHIYGSYTVTEAVTISEIGLSITGVDDKVQEFLIFHDVLSTPISLNPNDGITVHYYLTLDNP